MRVAKMGYMHRFTKKDAGVGLDLMTAILAPHD
jgi:hypothetical protein